MGFGDLSSPAGVKALNNYLADRSFIEGYTPSQADTVVFKALPKAPTAENFHALRWYNHIFTYGAEAGSFTGQKKAVSEYGPASTPADEKKDTNKKAAADDEDDDDFDMFASSDEEDEEAKAAKAARTEQRKKDAEAKKQEKKKKVVIAKSSIIFDVKPWSDETDLAEIEKCVRGIELDGLLWGASKLVAIGYGIKKLQICCVVEDDKVSTDDLEEQITSNEELVQSVDIVAFNKI